MKLIKLSLLLMAVIIFPALTLGEESTISPWKSYQKGVDFYHQRDYDKAGDGFLKALNTDDRTLEQWASYNLGDNAFEKARAIEEKDPAAALNLYNEALEYFRRAIIADHQDKNAKFNYELTAKKVKELDQQQKQNGQKQQNKQDKQKQGQDKNKQSTSNSGKDKEQNQQDNKQQDKQAKANKQDKPKEQSAAKDDQGKKGQQQQMSKDEALMLLNNFQRSEEKPQALITPDKENEPTEVDKDW